MPFMNNIKELRLVPGKVSGDIASFEAASAPLVSCICTINPIQSGSGDPSPSNVRPITGHDDVTITQKDGNNTIVDTTTITFPDTVYGASLDVGSGVLTITHKYVQVTTVNSPSSTGKTATINVSPMASGYTLETNHFYCNMLKPSNYSSATDNHVHFANASIVAFYFENTIGTTVAAWETFLENNPLYLCYQLATPTTTQLTPEQLNSILGDNNFYHDGNGPIDITYIRRIN
jgi:hypothetical protein